VNAVEVFQARRTDVETLASEARKSLRLWRGVYYTLGITAVIAATAAGASSLADLGGQVLAGILALLAVVLAAVEKFLGALNRVNSIGRRHLQLSAVRERLNGLIDQAQYREGEVELAADGVARVKLRDEASVWFDK
jgi:hypothetical protein